MENKKQKHIFAVVAYQESPYLDACLHSLTMQKCRSEIILCTATPSTFLNRLAAKYQIPVYVRTGGRPGIKDDWNFAFEQGSKRAELVTIAHQDDLYFPDYTKALLNAYRHFPDLSVFCCRYDTIDAAGNTVPGKAEQVKRILRLPLRNHRAADRSRVKLRALKWGNSIGCPSCTYHTKYCPVPLFDQDYRFVLDWAALLRLAESEGRFICIEKPLMAYRVHEGAETMANIRNHNREKEEREIFERLHGKHLADLLMHFYKKAYSAYGTEENEGADS